VRQTQINYFARLGRFCSKVQGMNTTVENVEVDFDQIQYQKVKEFIKLNGLNMFTDFSSLRPMCYNPAAEDSYRSHHEVFLIRRPVDIVWDIYKTISPVEAWNGDMVSFGLMYGRRTNTLNYLHDSFVGMERGQIIILNLCLFWGFLNIAVAHEVADIDEDKKQIKLCYMAGGASEGSQWITLNKTKEGFTSVDHLTRYKSKSAFRDKYLYPALHTKAIAEFHHNVRKKAESED
jgi:hypothetical protein